MSLVKACIKGNLDRCRYLVDHGFRECLYDLYDPYECPLLIIAVENEHFEIVKWLVEMGCDVREKDRLGITPMYSACLVSLTLAKWFFEMGAAADIRTPSRFGNTPFYAACESGNLETAQWLYQMGADDIHTKDLSGSTPMNAACAAGKLATAKWLAALGADIHVTDTLGWTPLVTACYYGHLDVVKWLVGMGADVKTKCPYNYNYPDFTPLKAASRGDVIYWLVLNGAVTGADGHANPTLVPSSIVPTLRAKVRSHDVFVRYVFKLLRGRRALVLVADFLGLLRGRALRTAREILNIPSQKSK